MLKQWYESLGFLHIDKGLYEKEGILIKLEKKEASISFYDNDKFMLSVDFVTDKYLLHELPIIINDLLKHRNEMSYMEFVVKFVSFLDTYLAMFKYY